MKGVAMGQGYHFCSERWLHLITALNKMHGFELRYLNTFQKK